MKTRNKIIYWTATALLAAGMLGSGFAQLFRAKDMVTLIEHVGYPLYFMYIIGVWKLLGVFAILSPKLTLVKEWAYAGFFFLLTGALFSHLALGDTGKAIAGPLMQAVFLIVSYLFRPGNRKLECVNLNGLQ